MENNQSRAWGDHSAVRASAAAFPRAVSAHPNAKVHILFM